MNKRLEKIVSLMLALLVALAVSPASLAGGMEPSYTVPSGYNAHDYEKCVAFLEQESIWHNTNGYEINESYDPNDPETWGHYWHTMDDGFTYYLPCFAWKTVGGEKRLESIYVKRDAFAGYLDLAGCTALQSVRTGGKGMTGADFTGCAAMTKLICGGTLFGELILTGCSALEELRYGTDTQCSGLDLSACTALKNLDVQGDDFTELDISHNTKLEWLDCSYNELTSLDLSHCPKLTDIFCMENKLTELDFSCNPLIPFGGLVAEGSGHVSCALSSVIPDYSEFYGGVYAEPIPGEDFLGWYDSEGTLVSAEETFPVQQVYNGVLTARFTGDSAVYIGDVDGNGVVNAGDALIVLRFALGIISDVNEQLADADGSGSVTANDALLILRAALGLCDI